MDAAKLLPQAEVAALDEVIERSGMADGMAVLDLGCGWGSGALHYATRLPRAHVIGVSNSHSQRAHILADAKRLGLTNLDIVTVDVSKAAFAEAAAAALARLRATNAPASGGGGKAEGGVPLFDRVVSLEMFEHMKNYDKLMKHVADVRRAAERLQCIAPAITRPPVSSRAPCAQHARLTRPPTRARDLQALVPGGRLFVHIFVHRDAPYHFEAKSEADWMVRAAERPPLAVPVARLLRALPSRTPRWPSRSRHVTFLRAGRCRRTSCCTSSRRT